jgi:steroid delta-isomerase-like uncharacterized protein
MNEAESLALTFSNKIWNERDLDYVQESFSPNCKIHSPLGEYQSPKQMLEIIQTWFKAFPDLIVNHLTPITEGNRVAIQWQAQGTHKGAFQGIEPTDKPIHYNGVTIYEIQDGKISQYWAYVNVHTLLKQISDPKC